MKQNVKKFWMILGICLGSIIVLFVILMFTLFALRKTEIDFQTTTSVFASESLQSDVLSSAEFKRGQSVFVLDKQLHISKMEKANPYVKINNIEIVFPNKVVVHCSERESVYAVKQDDVFLLCDKEMKVLQIADEFSSNQDNEILISLDNLSGSNYDVGDFVKFANENKNVVLKNFVNGMLINNRNSNEMKSYFNNISFSVETEPVSAKQFIKLCMENHSGLVYEIYQAEDEMINKLAQLLKTDVLLADAVRDQYKMIVYETSEGDIKSQLIKINP